MAEVLHFPTTHRSELHVVEAVVDLERLPLRARGGTTTFAEYTPRTKDEHSLDGQLMGIILGSYEVSTLGVNLDSENAYRVGKLALEAHEAPADTSEHLLAAIGGRNGLDEPDYFTVNLDGRGHTFQCLYDTSLSERGSEVTIQLNQLDTEYAEEQRRKARLLVNDALKNGFQSQFPKDIRTLKTAVWLRGSILDLEPKHF